MNQKDIVTIRKVQAILIRINTGEKFFYNATQYERLGLIQAINKKVTWSNGNTEMVFDRHVLTKKGKRYLNFTI